MKYIIYIMLNIIIIANTAHAACDNCCQAEGGIHECDSSTGRYVCNNGDYSTCYCTRHAIMDLQKIEGCCLWQGGVFKISPTGLVICRNGGISELCSLDSANGTKYLIGQSEKEF